MGRQLFTRFRWGNIAFLDIEGLEGVLERGVFYGNHNLFKSVWVLVPFLVAPVIVSTTSEAQVFEFGLGSRGKFEGVCGLNFDNVCVYKINFYYEIF
ncbi:unnamed protein product [Moneuplotes crassus]|uniref:Uncharacterized protein n=1 Tax=Euplotes crassus TaxID=5936 RepID=A0AAD1Y5V7_EUPCR|nr:unnamed protein product [Moneuplotes crassus]